MHKLGLCTKINSFVAHMLYAWSFGHNISVPISIKQNKYYFSLNADTTVFASVDGNLNKNST